MLMCEDKRRGGVAVSSRFYTRLPAGEYHNFTAIGMSDGWTLKLKKSLANGPLHEHGTIIRPSRHPTRSR